MTALTLLVMAAGFLANPIPGVADPSYDTQESQFLTLLNNYRESQGLNDLVPQDNLNAAADWYATDMAAKNYYGGDQYCYDNFQETAHCDSLGRLPGARLTAFGYPPSIAGENIAAGFGSAQSVFDAWKASPGHNANLLGSIYKAIGIGWACNSQADFGCYWVTDFGSYAGPPSSNAPTPPPAPTATPTSLPTNTPSPTPVPTPTPVHHTWDDVNCDGAITADDAVEVLRGSAGFHEERAGCPPVGNLVFFGGAYHIWGDTDCSGGVAALDGIQLLEQVAGLSPGVTNPNCPAPGAPA